jgi:ubiquinone/menaquinone biosynthesis C-methylase UbiE
MRQDFLANVPFPTSAHMLEVGCGTGVLTRALAQWPSVSTVVGVDMAPSLLSKARELAVDLPNLTFLEADARSLPFEDETFDVVVFHTTLTHVPSPERALAEAFRVLRPLGCLAVFDGDYATGTVALSDHDLLQTCVDAIAGTFVHDPWLGRRLPALVRDCGFEIEHFRGHSLVESSEAEYMLTIVDRAIDTLHA